MIIIAHICFITPLLKKRTRIGEVTCQTKCIDNSMPEELSNLGYVTRCGNSPFLAKTNINWELNCKCQNRNNQEWGYEWNPITQWCTLSLTPGKCIPRTENLTCKATIRAYIQLNFALALRNPRSAYSNLYYLIFFILIAILMILNNFSIYFTIDSYYINLCYKYKINSPITL